MKDNSVLENRPVRIFDSEPTTATLSKKFDQRILSVLAKYECEPTEAGLCKLAVVLALKHEPEMRVETPVDRRKKEAGAEPKITRVLCQYLVDGLVEMGKSKSDAAKWLTCNWKRMSHFTTSPAPSAASIRNMVTPSGRRNTRIPRAILRERYEKFAKVAAFEAAERIIPQLTNVADDIRQEYEFLGCTQPSCAAYRARRNPGEEIRIWSCKKCCRQ